MSNTEFVVSVAEELVEELDDLTEQCIELQASRPEIVGRVAKRLEFPPGTLSRSHQ